MALILNIDTSTESASIALAHHEQLLALSKNNQQKDHAGWIQEAIQNLLRDAGYRLNQLNAIAVTIGPGSYTGLRVGLATAKGLCYGLNIPLISLGTLEVMAIAAKQHMKEMNLPTNIHFCPMIDARRLEVFTAIFDSNLIKIIPPTAMILDQSSFEKELDHQSILFFGNGSQKWKSICKHSKARFADVEWDSSAMISAAFSSFRDKKFADISYSEPAYLKEFYIHH